MHHCAGDSAVLHQILDEIQDLSVPDGGKFKVFTGCRRSGQYEDSRADDRPDPKRSERDRAQRLFQTRLRVLRIRDQLVYRFLGEQLAGNSWLLTLAFSNQPRTIADRPEADYLMPCASG
jgi:hypothetical protein